jgi:Flp pilus assembly protein TadB
MKGERPFDAATRRLEQDILREDAQFHASFTTACDQLDPRTTRPHPRALRTGIHIHWSGLKPIVLWAIVAIIGLAAVVAVIAVIAAFLLLTVKTLVLLVVATLIHRWHG